MAKQSRDPWHKKTCKLIMTDEALPLLLAKGKKGKSPSNEFKLVAGPRTKGRVNYYKVQAKQGAIADCWRDCIFVPRGNRPPELKGSLGARSTSKQKLGAAMRFIKWARRRPISIRRLDCDVTLPVTYGARAGERGEIRKTFGSLRLYQVPKKLGRDALLVFSFEVDADPDGSGGAGSVHN